MFWGLILNPNEQFIQKSEGSFHLSKASLDLRSCIYEPIQVMYTHNYNSYVMCTLQYGKFFDCAIDLKFKKGDSLSFSTTGGKGTVHLIAYVMDDGEIEPAVGDNMNGEGIVSEHLKQEVLEKNGNESEEAGEDKVPEEKEIDKNIANQQNPEEPPVKQAKTTSVTMAIKPQANIRTLKKAVQVQDLKVGKDVKLWWKYEELVHANENVQKEKDAEMLDEKYKLLKTHVGELLKTEKHFRLCCDRNRKKRLEGPVDDNARITSVKSLFRRTPLQDLHHVYEPTTETTGPSTTNPAMTCDFCYPTIRHFKFKCHLVKHFLSSHSHRMAILLPRFKPRVRFTKISLQNHLIANHEGTGSCRICGVVFPTFADHKNHVGSLEHKVLMMMFLLDLQSLDDVMINEAVALHQIANDAEKECCEGSDSQKVDDPPENVASTSGTQQRMRARIEIPSDSD